MILIQINQASLSMFSRFFRHYRPAKCIQFHYKSNHILYEQIEFLSELFVAYRECILAHADRIRLTAVHKIGSNWLTQEVYSEVGRGSRFKMWTNLSAVWPSKLSCGMDYSENMSDVFETSAIPELTLSYILSIKDQLSQLSVIQKVAYAFWIKVHRC